MYNATCRIIEISAERTDSDALQTEHTEGQWPERRCYLRQMSTHEEAAALGRVAIGAFRLRVVSDREIRAGWRVMARIDGETAWREYVVRRAQKTMHWNLMVERV